jgi:outer membrane protein TolC
MDCAHRNWRGGSISPSLLVVAALAAGCASSRPGPSDHLADRIVPPSARVAQAHTVTSPNVQTADGRGRSPVDSPSAGGSTSPAVVPASGRLDSTQDNAAEPPKLQPETKATPETVTASQEVIEQDGTQAGPITLPQAIQLSFRRQPRLRVYLSSIGEAQGRADVAFSPYLPTLSGGMSGGGFDLNVTGQAAGFSFLPPGATIPIGLNLESGYGLAEVRMQWLICDFGRRASHYCQAELGVEIAKLQTDRAYQTVANEVAVAYYQVLRAASLRRIAQETVRRAEDDLGVARKLEKGGVIEREKVLRAEVQLAQSQRQLDASEGAFDIAVSALNFAMGINVTAPTQAVEVSQIPPLPASLHECLQAATQQRRELGVARAGVQVTQEGCRAAKADFLPKIVAEGDYFNFEQATPRANLGLGLGFIKLEWGLFEGGRRTGELRVADAKTRAAMALAESVADTISFQTVETYRQMVTAFNAIKLAEPAVVQARENYRLVKARAAQGDATSTEITDAETALTRADQDYQNSIYDYLTARAKLEFAIGEPPEQAYAQ